MKKNRLLLFVLSLLFFGWSNLAISQIRTPAPSPNATVSQKIGVTNVTIDYSSPGVKGREGKIWGELEAYDVAWRAGANAPTKITFEDQVTIGGKELKAGSYNIFITLSKESDWLVHLNTGGSVFSFRGNQDSLKSLDAVTLKVKPKWTSNAQERLKYSVDYISDNEGTVTMSWEKVRITFKVTTETKKLVAKSMENQIGNWFNFANSAIYYANNDLDLSKAEKWVNLSLALEEKHFYPKWAKGIVLAKAKKYTKALEFATKAKEIGDALGGKNGFYNANQKAVEKLISELKEKTPVTKGKKKKKGNKKKR